MFPVSNEKRITPLPCDVGRALLREYYHVGDEVDIDLLRKGVVVGFGTKHVPRGGLNHEMAGVYIDFEVLRVVPKLASLPERLIHRLVLERPPHDCRDNALWATYKDRERYANIFIRIGDLPETAFWEGDTVIYAHDQNRGFGEDAHWCITDIDYTNPDFPCWLHSCKDWRTAVSGSINNLVLIKRGNLWKMHHGEKMEFTSIGEEALFYKSLGMSQKVMDGRYLEVPFNEGIRFLRMGGADQMKLKNKKDLTYVLIKYDNEVFGARMRAHTLARLELSEEVTP